MVSLSVCKTCTLVANVVKHRGILTRSWRAVNLSKQAHAAYKLDPIRMRQAATCVVCSRVDLADLQTSLALRLQSG